MLDEPDAILKKFKRAVTDSGTEIVRATDKPGISNLIEILAVIRGTSAEDVEREFADSRYGDFKVAVGEAVVDPRAGAGALRRAARATRRELERILAGGRRRRARWRGDAGRRPGADGRRRAARSVDRAP